MTKTVLLPLLLLIAATGCRDAGPQTAKNAEYAAPLDRGALDQQWTETTSQHFWWTSQGSQVVPYDHLLNLERADSQDLFATNQHFEQLRYITVPEASAMNPGGLPIGLVKNQAQVDGLDVMGFTCAACHTAKWQVNGVDVLVEGGPSKGDMQTFFNQLLASMHQTLDQPDKLARFAARVGGDAAAVKATLARWTDRLDARDRRNPIPPEFEGGFGRVDALTAIINEVTAGDLGIAENARVAEAPVSYPHVWDAPQHDLVQWNGSIPNAGVGPALRNIGEVMGVYGSIVITPRRGRLPRYPDTTAEMKNLHEIEQDLWALASPLWPEALAPSDKSLAEAGKPIYEAQCASCHLPISRLNPARRIVAQMKDVGTDPTVNQSLTRPVKTGVLEGTPKLLNPTETFRAEASPVDVLMNVVFGAYLAQKSAFPLAPTTVITDVRKTGRRPSFGRLFEGLDQDVQRAVEGFQSAASQFKQAYQLTGNAMPAASNNYKARPLNGIWATGPFLHNGSVPTLSELLKPDGERVKEFYMGSWVLDTENVGITNVPEEGGVPHYLFKTSTKGNSNAGHNYGTSLTPEQKKQLIEYVKTL